MQCGHWLYHAPHLNAAAFLAKQAGEEISHVKRILRILSVLGEPPGPAHRVIRFLSTGMMGGSWGEHVALEMALGEGLVLAVFYAMAETIPDPEIRKILETAAVEEERHVEFGEKETLDWVARYPQAKPLLLGLAWIQLWALQKLKQFVIRRLRAETGNGHPVLGQFEKFYDHAVECFEWRIERLGLGQLSRLSRFKKTSLVLLLPWRKLVARFSQRQSLLTASYLDDPVLRAEFQRYRSS